MGSTAERFEATAEETVSPERRAGTWPVYGRYEVVSRDGGDVEIKAQQRRAPAGMQVRDWWELPASRRAAILGDGLGHPRTYRPLVDTPGLFVAFARLPETVTEAVLLDWTNRYGTLGPDSRSETLSRFRQEAHDAKRALRLYEAATGAASPDREAIEEMLGNHELEPGRYAVGDRASAHDYALLEVELIARRRLAEHTYPDLHQRDLGEPFSPAFGFRSLLGALYLQLYYVLTAESAPRCQAPECDRLIPPGSRSHRKYCGSPACKQRVYDRKKRSS